MINSGDLRQRVILQRQTNTPDELNEPNGTWEVITTVWSKVETLSGRELFNARQVSATSTHKLTMRSGVIILATDRFVWNNKTLNIDNLNAVDWDGYLIVQASEQHGNTS